MRLPPDPFICAACNGTIYDEWGGCLIEIHADQDPQWWSDGTFIDQGEAPRGDFEVCPLCDSAMPRAFIKEAQELYKQGKPYPHDELVLRIFGPVYDRSDVAPDLSNQVRLPEIMTWAQLDYIKEVDRISDPVLLTLCVSAMLRMANGNYTLEQEFQLQEPEVNWYMTQVFPNTFKAFLAKVKNHEITEFSMSTAFGGTIAEKIGYFRFNMIVAELSRNYGDFEYAARILCKMESQLSKLGNIAKPDDPKDRDKYSSAWPIEAVDGFIKVSRRMIQQQNPSLALVASVSSEIAWEERDPFGRGFFSF